MTYEFKCEACEERWEEFLSVNNRDKPLTEPCPKCAKEGCVKRCVSAGSVTYAGFISPITRAGGEWNDVLKTIHKGAGKNSKIETK